jgi:hypothetical protein
MGTEHRSPVGDGGEDVRFIFIRLSQVGTREAVCRLPVLTLLKAVLTLLKAVFTLLKAVFMLLKARRMLRKAVFMFRKAPRIVRKHARIIRNLRHKSRWHR